MGESCLVSDERERLRDCLREFFEVLEGAVCG